MLFIYSLTLNHMNTKKLKSPCCNATTYIENKAWIKNGPTYNYLCCSNCTKPLIHIQYDGLEYSQAIETIIDADYSTIFPKLRKSFQIRDMIAFQPYMP